MKARIQSVTDLRHEDEEKLPKLVFHVPGSEIAEAVKAVAFYVGGPVSLRLNKKALSVLFQDAKFFGEKEALFRIVVEAGHAPLDVSTGQEVEIEFKEGDRA